MALSPITLPRLGSNWQNNPSLVSRSWNSAMNTIESAVNGVISAQNAAAAAQTAADAAQTMAETAQTDAAAAQVTATTAQTTATGAQTTAVNAQTTASSAASAAAAAQTTANSKLGSFTNLPGWLSWTPTVTAGSGTITAKSVNNATYFQIGSLVYFQYDISITTNGTGAGSVGVTLPLTPTSETFVGSGRDTGLTSKMLQVVVAFGASVLQFYDGSYPGANGARLVASGFYKTTATSIPVVSTVS